LRERQRSTWSCIVEISGYAGHHNLDALTRNLAARCRVDELKESHEDADGVRSALTTSHVDAEEVIGTSADRGCHVNDGPRCPIWDRRSREKWEEDHDRKPQVRDGLLCFSS
jgi:hypothetical protein